MANTSGGKGGGGGGGGGGEDRGDTTAVRFIAASLNGCCNCCMYKVFIFHDMFFVISQLCISLASVCLSVSLSLCLQFSTTMDNKVCKKVT